MSSSQAAGGSTWKCSHTLGPGSCWASLPEDLIRMVASRLLDSDFLDYVRFRAVCTSWRSRTTSPSGRGVTDPRFHPRRWMLLPEGHCLYPGHPNLHGYVRFLNLDTGTLVHVQILLLGDHCAIDSVDGLLLLLRNLDEEGTVFLLHPFTGDITELPPLGTLLPQPQVDSWLPNGPTLYRIRCYGGKAVYKEEQSRWLNDAGIGTVRGHHGNCRVLRLQELVSWSPIGESLLA